MQAGEWLKATLDMLVKNILFILKIKLSQTDLQTLLPQYLRQHSEQ